MGREQRTLCVKGRLRRKRKLQQVAGRQDSGPRGAHCPSSGSEWRWSRAAWSLGGGSESLREVTRQAHRWVLGQFNPNAGVGLEARPGIACSATRCPVATCWGLTRQVGKCPFVPYRKSQERTGAGNGTRFCGPRGAYHRGHGQVLSSLGAVAGGRGRREVCRNLHDVSVLQRVVHARAEGACAVARCNKAVPAAMLGQPLQEVFGVARVDMLSFCNRVQL